MRLETLTRILLLSAALGAGSSVLAAEIAASAERPAGSESTLRRPAGQAMSNVQEQRRAVQIKRKTKDNKAVADTGAALNERSAADKTAGVAGEAVPENHSPAEPQPVTLRGVRG